MQRARTSLVVRHFFLAVGKGTLMTVFKAFSFALKDFAAIVVEMWI